MIRVKILGTGCAKCAQLAEAVHAVIVADGIAAEVEKGAGHAGDHFL